MKGFIVALVTIVLLIIFMIPAFLVYHGANEGCCLLYLPFCVLGGLWGNVVFNFLES
jgi:hypothetical protein